MVRNPAATPATRSGVALGFVLALIGASAFRGVRIEAGGMLIHPYLVPMFVLFAMIAASRLSRFPRDVLLAIVVFLALYAISALPSPGILGELLKVVATFVTAITCALCIRTLRDFWAATAGLNVAAAVMTVKGFAAGLVAYAGYNPLEDIANKNAFSLYALPPVLLGGYVILDPRAPRWFRIALLLNAGAIAFSVFSGANRSGWLGMILIGVALAGRGRRIRGTIVMGAIGALTYVLLHFYGTTEVLEYRIQQTRQGYSSDVRREVLLTTAISIGFENPILGVSPQQLPFDLARETNALERVVDPHNVFGLIIGGSGFVTLAAFLWLGAVVWRRPPFPTAPHSPARYALHLLRIQAILFAVRGMFSREILYSPTFGAGFGLCIGLCLVEYRLAVSARAVARRGVLAASPRPTPPAPSTDLTPATP